MVANVLGRGQARRLAMSPGVRCIVNGVDVTPFAQYADTRRGVARLLKLRDGRPYVDAHGDIAKETVRGTVRLIRGRA
jgi:hypothetical protein